MSDAVIIDAVRTPLGRRNGGLSAIHPVDLSASVLQALADRTGVDPGQVDDVVWGVVNQVGDQSVNLARSAVLAANWPAHVPGVSLDRQCGSSQQAIHFAAASLVAGHADVVVAGGVESMTRVPMGSARVGGTTFGRTVLDRYGVEGFSQGEGAELMIDQWGFSRTAVDEFALESHRRASVARAEGQVDDTIISVDGLDHDECVRPDTTLERLAALKPVFRANGRITAGNSSAISDGAAGLLMTTGERASELGLRPIARVHTAVVTGDDPVLMLGGVIPATHKLLAKAGVKMADIGVYEVNEAFAPVPLAWLAETGADPSRLNPWGGAIALGHPLGASGAVLMGRLVTYLQRHGVRYGLQVMCEGGGMANATLVERL